MFSHVIQCPRCLRVSVSQTKVQWRYCKGVTCRLCGKRIKIKPFFPQYFGLDISSPSEATQLCILTKCNLKKVGGWTIEE